MPSQFGCARHPKFGTLANQSNDVRVLSELRRPAAIKAFCRHSHVTELCSICMREHEARIGLVAPRL